MLTRHLLNNISGIKRKIGEQEMILFILIIVRILKVSGKTSSLLMTDITHNLQVLNHSRSVLSTRPPSTEWLASLKPWR